MTALRVCTFKGIQNLPLYVAREQGYFAAQGLEVTVEYTAGSAPQLAGLARGAYDLVQTAPDNVINMDTDPAAFGLDPAMAPRALMVLGGSTGPLGLYAQPQLHALDDLRGTTLGVDNPTSGFALLMRDMLARAGLSLERDYAVTVAGGTSARLDALRSGSAAATLLYAPYDALAVADGFRLLTASTDHYPAYASLATAALASWIDRHSAAVTGYIGAVLQALGWIDRREHAAAVQAILQREPALGLDAATAALAYRAFTDPQTGFGVDARLDADGLHRVMEIRTAYANPPRPLGQPDDYLDLRWYDAARSDCGQDI